MKNEQIKKNNQWIILSVLLALIAGLLVTQVAFSAKAKKPSSKTITSLGYQGFLDAGLEEINSNCEMVFRIFDSLNGGRQFGQTVEQTVSVQENRFTVVLDFGKNFDEQNNLWLDVAVQCPGDTDFFSLERQKISTTDLLSEDISNQSDVAGLPVGTIIDWWRPTLTTTLPTDYVICDGSVVYDAASPLNGQTLPNLNDRFVFGNTNWPSVGFTMGGDDHHSHSLDLPSHTHNFDHKHQKTHSTATFDTTDNLGDHWFGGLNVLQVPGRHHVHYVVPEGETLETSTDGGQSGSQDYAPQDSEDGTYLPAYIGLLKLCKIK